MLRSFFDNKTYVYLILFIFLISTLMPNMISKNICISNTSELEIDNIYDLMIICPKNFKRFLEPLVEHKNNHNVKTILLTLDEIYKNSIWGRDNPEKIKYMIKEGFDNYNIKYVLLVGSFRNLPVRYVHNSEDKFNSFNEPMYISDLYYGDLYDNESNFQTWDSDSDGVFGEWTVNKSNAKDKYIDLRPDVYVGRLACRNIFEVMIMVDKIIKYETKTYGSDWFNNFVTVAGDTYAEGEYEFDTSAIEGEEDAKKVIENMTGFNQVRLWISNGNFTGQSDVIKAINSGCGLMFFSGHASPLSWGTHPINNSDVFVFGLKNFHMWRLFNKYKLPVVVAGACHNAQFDVTPLNLLKNPIETINHYAYSIECWAWKFTSKPFGGAIAVIANSGLGMSKEDKLSREGAGDYMDIQFFYVYGNKESDILGECWGRSIDRYLDKFPVDWEIEDSSPYVHDAKYDLKTVQQFTLLGDPSLKIGGYK